MDCFFDCLDGSVGVLAGLLFVNNLKLIKFLFDFTLGSGYLDLVVIFSSILWMPKARQVDKIFAHIFILVCIERHRD